jgi:FkbM family methyltransferase
MRAHVCYFSVLLADMVGPVGRLLAIEPQLHLADLIDRSLYLSGYRERSEVICCALGPQEGSVDIAVREAYSSGGTVVAKLDMLGTEWVTRPVRQRRLDDIVKERGMKPVDLILIDTEGYEPLVLDGCPSVNDFVARLHDQGFRIWEICGTGELLERSASELSLSPGCDVFLSRRTIEEFDVAST